MSTLHSLPELTYIFFTLLFSFIFSHSANLFFLSATHRLSFSLTLTTIFVIFSYSANLLPSNSFSLPSTPVFHIHLFFQPCSLTLLLNAGPSCSLALLIVCRTLMFSHSAITVNAGPSCSLALLIACRALMFSHSANYKQDPPILSLC